VIDRGTAWQARQGGFQQPAAGKTGTTNDYRDAWFVGYTPDLAAGVWVGFDRPRTIVPGGYAGDLAVPIWGAFMRDATAGTKGRPFPRPPGLVAVEICLDSGLLPMPACSRVRRVSSNGESREVSAIAAEYFRPGTAPTEPCPIHEDSWFGGVRTASFNPSELPASSTLRRLAAPPIRGLPDSPNSGDTTLTPVKAEAVTARPAKVSEKKSVWRRFFGAFKNRDN
jgi:membrane peptidoglycan carboxypeptidase